MVTEGNYRKVLLIATNSKSQVAIQEQQCLVYPTITNRFNPHLQSGNGA